VVARRQRLAELDVSAAAVKLLAGNVLAGTATVGNVGSVRARSSTADVAWKSASSGGLVQLGLFTVPALKPGQRDKVGFQVDLPRCFEQLRGERLHGCTRSGSGARQEEQLSRRGGHHDLVLWREGVRADKLRTLLATSY
jgi:hypothetical protein